MDSLSLRTAQVVSTAIDAAGLTQLGVSETTGIPRATLIRRLRGQSPFTLTELAAVAEVLDTTVGDLLRTVEDAAPVEPVSA